MSQHFRLWSWALALPLRRSCIQSGRVKRYCSGCGPARCKCDWWSDDLPEWVSDQRHYALAEDLRGHHLPYPKLPKWGKRLWEWRVRLGDRVQRPCPTRGREFQFRCPDCKAGSFFSLRNSRCRCCDALFNERLEFTGRLLGGPFGLFEDLGHRPMCAVPAPDYDPTVYDDPFQDE